MPTKKKHRQKSSLTQWLILGGVILLALAIVGLKDRSPEVAQTSNSAQAAAQLERARNTGKPALAFFHSNNCEQCIVMIDIVKQVLPQFAASVALVDVNVYDPANEDLMRQVRLQYIPMLVFYDRAGQMQSHVGVMEADELRRRLDALAEAP